MNRKANYFKIGLFVTITLIILIIGIIVLSAGPLRRNELMMETYIDESVQGLSVGSPVMQRGVQIGRVEKITFVPDEYDMAYGTDEFVQYSKYVVVIMAINRTAFADVDEERLSEIIQQYIDSGLRLKLAYQGITGIAYIDADYVDAKRYKPMTKTWEPKRLYIPSAQSTLTNFTEAIDTVFQRLDHIDFEQISVQLLDTLNALNKAIDEAQVASLHEELTGLITEIRQTNGVVLGLMDKSKGDMAAANIPDTIAQFNRTLKRLDNLVAGQHSEIEEIMSNLAKTSENLRDLTEYAKKYPSQILLGGPPPESEVVK